MSLAGKMGADSKYTREEAITFVNHMENVEKKNLDAELKSLSVDIEDMINDDMRMTNESNLKDLLDFGSKNHIKMMNGLKKKSPEMYEQINYIFRQEQGKLDDGVRGLMMVQASLNALGYCGKDGLELELDGSFGPQTFYALVKFQVQSKKYKALGGKPDSITGRLTVEALINDLNKGIDATSVEEREVKVQQRGEEQEVIGQSREELDGLLEEFQDRFDEWYLLLIDKFPGLKHEEGKFEYKGQAVTEEELIVDGKPKLRKLMEWLNHLKHIEEVQSKISKLPKGAKLASWPIEKLDEIEQLRDEAQEAVNNAINVGIKKEELDTKSIEAVKERIDVMRAIIKAVKDVKKLPIGADLKKQKLADLNDLNDKYEIAMLSIGDAIDKGADKTYIESILIYKITKSATRAEHLTVNDVLMKVHRKLIKLEAKLYVKEDIDKVQGLIDSLPIGSELANRKVENLLELKAKRGEVEVELHEVLSGDFIEGDDFDLAPYVAVNKRIIELEKEAQMKVILQKAKDDIGNIFKDVNIDSYDESNVVELKVKRDSAFHIYESAKNQGVDPSKLVDEDYLINKATRKIDEIEQAVRIRKLTKELDDLVADFDCLDKSDINCVRRDRNEALKVYNELSKLVDPDSLKEQKEKIDDLTKIINDLEDVEKHNELMEALRKAVDNLPDKLDTRTVDDLPDMVKTRNEAEKSYDDAKDGGIPVSSIKNERAKIDAVSDRINKIIEEAKRKCEDITGKLEKQTGAKTKVEVTTEGKIIIIINSGGDEVKIDYIDVKDAKDIKEIVKVIKEKKEEKGKLENKIKKDVESVEKNLEKENDPGGVKTGKEVEEYKFKGGKVSDIKIIIINIRKDCEANKDIISTDEYNKIMKKLDEMDQKIDRIEKLFEIQQLLITLLEIPNEDELENKDKDELKELYNYYITIIQQIKTINTLNNLNLTINLNIYQAKIDAIKKKEEEAIKKDNDLEKNKTEAEKFANKYPDVNFENDRLIYTGMVFGSDPFELISNFNNDYTFQDWYNHWRSYGIRKDEAKEIYDDGNLNSLYVNKLKNQTFTHEELGLDKIDDFVSMYLDNYGDSSIIPKSVYNRFVDTNNIELDDVSLGKFTSRTGNKGQKLQDENDIFLSFNIDDSYKDQKFNKDRFIMLMNILSDKTEPGGKNLEIDRKKLVREMRRVIQLAIADMKKEVETSMLYDNAGEKNDKVVDRINEHIGRQGLYSFSKEELDARGLDQAQVDEWFREFEDSNLDMCSAKIGKKGGKTVVNFEFWDNFPRSPDAFPNKPYNKGHSIEIDNVCDARNKRIDYTKMKKEIKRCILNAVERKFEKVNINKKLKAFSFSAEDYKPDNIDNRKWMIWKSHFDKPGQIKLTNIELKDGQVHFNFDDNNFDFKTRTENANIQIPVDAFYKNGVFNDAAFKEFLKRRVSIASNAVKNEICDKDKTNAEKFYKFSFNADNIKPDGMDISHKIKFNLWKGGFKDPTKIGLIKTKGTSGLDIVNGKVKFKFAFDDKKRNRFGGNAEDFNEDHTVDLYEFMNFDTGLISISKMREAMKKCVKTALTKMP